MCTHYFGKYTHTTVYFPKSLRCPELPSVRGWELPPLPPQLPRFRQPPLGRCWRGSNGGTLAVPETAPTPHLGLLPSLNKVFRSTSWIGVGARGVSQCPAARGPVCKHRGLGEPPRLCPPTGRWPAPVPIPSRDSGSPPHTVSAPAGLRWM